MRYTAKTARGQIVYDHHCRRCHSEGEGGLGPSLNDKKAPPFLIKLQVRKGLGAMPSFTECEISDAELDDLVCYMLARRSY
jgi:mono/diheme cytochrome c family protein